MNKIVSGILAFSIYLGVIFLILLYYNVHKIKSKNYVEKNSNRVTVTLVNSDKTVFNKNSKISIPKKPVPIHHIIKRQNIKRDISPKRDIVKSKTPYRKNILKRENSLSKKSSKQIAKAKERAKKRALAKRIEARKIALAKKKRIAELKRRAKEEARKKALAKKRAKRIARIKAIKRAKARRERERRRRIRERAKNLFSSIKTPIDNSSSRREPTDSHIRHQSSIADRIRNTHLSGIVDSRNRERGVVNEYIAKVKNRLSNWNAQSEYKGQSATIKITITNSGHFIYSVRHSSSRALTIGLKRFLDQLNRIGLGVHNKSTPYIIEVTFRAR